MVILHEVLILFLSVTAEVVHFFKTSKLYEILHNLNINIRIYTKILHDF